MLLSVATGATELSLGPCRAAMPGRLGMLPALGYLRGQEGGQASPVSKLSVPLVTSKRSWGAWECRY